MFPSEMTDLMLAYKLRELANELERFITFDINDTKIIREASYRIENLANRLAVVGRY